MPLEEIVPCSPFKLPSKWRPSAWQATGPSKARRPQAPKGPNQLRLNRQRSGQRSPPRTKQRRRSRRAAPGDQQLEGFGPRYRGKIRSMTYRDGLACCPLRRLAAPQAVNEQKKTKLFFSPRNPPPKKASILLYRYRRDEPAPVLAPARMSRPAQAGWRPAAAWWPMKRPPLPM